MEDNKSIKAMWNEAGKAGLALGAVSTIYLFASQILGNVESESSFLTYLMLILWAAKFGGCIWFMRFFMKKFAAENPEADNRATRRFGTAAALLSAIVYSAITFANVAFISPDTFAQQTDLLIQQMAPFLDSNAMAAMDSYRQNLPQITFFTNLIYCFLFGTVLAAILSIKIPDTDPFADYEPEEE